MESAKHFAVCRTVPCKQDYSHPQMSFNFLLVLFSKLKKNIPVYPTDLVLSPICVAVISPNVLETKNWLFHLCMKL